MVVRSLWAALGVVWVMGLLLGWDVDRLVVFWPVSWDVVVAVDIGTWNLLEDWMEGSAAKTADRLVAARVWKSPWLVTLLQAYGGRLAIEATMEPPVTVSRNQRLKIPDKREKGAGLRDQWASAEGRADFCSPISRPVRLPTTQGRYEEGCLVFYRAVGCREGCPR